MYYNHPFPKILNLQSCKTTAINTAESPAQYLQKTRCLVKTRIRIQSCKRREARDGQSMARRKHCSVSKRSIGPMPFMAIFPFSSGFLVKNGSWLAKSHQPGRLRVKPWCWDRNPPAHLAGRLLSQACFTLKSPWIGNWQWWKWGNTISFTMADQIFKSVSINSRSYEGWSSAYQSGNCLNHYRESYTVYSIHDAGSAIPWN